MLQPYFQWMNDLAVSKAIGESIWIYPLVQAIHRLVDHAAETDARLEALIAQLQSEGADVGDAKATAERFDPKRLNQMLD